MDPNTTLRAIRVIVDRVLTADADAQLWELAELISALDDWIARGGQLPRPWIVTHE